MSDNEKDNKNFEFIKEQVIEKKHKKLRKRLIPLLMTIVLAIIFGMIASVTFAVAEPKIYKLLHKEEDTKTPVTFPTQYPEDSEDTTDSTEQTETDNSQTTDDTEEETVKEPDTVIVEQSIDADVEDFVSMYDDIKKTMFDVEKSLVNVTSTSTAKDWLFDTLVDKTTETTGVVIANTNEELLVLVSLDRIKGANSIKIKFSDTEMADAIIQDYETDLNLAVIAVALEDIPQIYLNSIKPATLGESYTITVGSPILALGSPNGHPGSIDIGIISSLNNYVYITDNKLDLFNTDIDANDNSDGIIVNMSGEVIGLITRTLKDDLSKGVSTVIGISKIKPIIESLANKEPRVYFGVTTEDMTADAMLEHQITNGIYVNEVQADSPAFDAGISNGDIILEVNKQPILNTNYFNSIISEHQPGEGITVKLKRTVGSSEKEMDVTIILAKKVQ